MQRNCNQHSMKFLIMYEYRVSNESDTNCVGGADQKILPLSLTCRMEDRKKCYLLNFLTYAHFC